MSDLPKTEYAVQLVGPDKPVLNKEKEIVEPGAHQVVCRVEAVGLCFSDLKLLKQFSSHARKTAITGGIAPAILEEIPSYKPDDLPTVPGHEAVVRVAAVGPGIDKIKAGDRFLVQTDYRWLPTADSNASFGYNFEGALQEYVLMDERVITSPQGESMLIPVPEELSASAVALIEPWACVENAYACIERTAIKAGGKMLVVADVEVSDETLISLFDKYGKPTDVTWIGKSPHLEIADVGLNTGGDISQLPDAGFDDVIYFGSDAAKAEALFPKVAAKGLFNIVQCGGKFGKNVVTQVGRVHYGGIRLIGTTGSDPAEAMEYIPTTGELRKDDKVQVVGAAGPMGLMHVVRDLCQGVEGVSVYAGDLDDDRLAVLGKIVEPVAQKNGVTCRIYNPTKDNLDDEFDYIALMAPVPQLVAGAVKAGADSAIINIFAGIPATVSPQRY